ncbi:MAG: glyoxalase [Actinomycetes bacterium]
MNAAPRPHQLRTIEIGDRPEAWTAAGFDVTVDGVDGTVVLGDTTVRLTGTGDGFHGWAIDGVDAPVDGIAAVSPTPPVAETTHPNGVTRIDHIVVLTGNTGRTVSAFDAEGLAARRVRGATFRDRPATQTFLWAGDVIVEVVGPPDDASDDAPTSIMGFAVVAADLTTTASFLGDLAGPTRPAVQPGRTLLTLRHRSVDMALPMIVMSPHPGDQD